MIKPKVLFIGPLPPPYSGPELSMRQFLRSEDLNNFFLIYFLQTNFRKSNKNKGKFDSKAALNSFVFFIKLIYLLLIRRPKLVYYPVTATQLGWIGRDVWTILLSKMFGAKVVIHLRGSHFKLNFATFNKYVKKIIVYSLRKVDMALVQADYLHDQFQPYIPKTCMRTLYQSMNLKEFPYADATKREKNKILIIGHMTKAKGYTDILKIIPNVANRFPDVQFCFAGEMRRGERGVFLNQFTNEKIEYENPFEKEKELLNSRFKDNYKNIGLIYGDEKLKQLQSASLFVSASYSEGFSRALLEAMSVGLPLVYTQVGAHREVLGEQNGIAVVPGELKDLEFAIINMLESDSLFKIGLVNRLKVENEFSDEKICAKFKEILTEILKGNS